MEPRSSKDALTDGLAHRTAARAMLAAQAEFHTLSEDAKLIAHALLAVEAQLDSIGWCIAEHE